MGKTFILCYASFCAFDQCLFSDVVAFDDFSKALEKYNKLKQTEISNCDEETDKGEYVDAERGCAIFDMQTKSGEEFWRITIKQA